MKLLGWMHRKLKLNSNGEVKNRTILQQTFDDHQIKYHVDPTFGSNHKIWKETQGEVEEKAMKQEVFQGFLTIGTLGSEAFNTTDQPPTPTFPTTFDETNQETTTPITYQEAEDEDEGNSDNEGYSSKRSSYASIITLSGKQVLEDNDKNAPPQDFVGNFLDECPLHKYFLGSSIGICAGAEMGIVKKQEEEECSRDKKRGSNKAQQFAKNLLKKMLNNLNYSKSKKKFPKVLKMFKKKVHPDHEKFTNGDEKQREIIMEGDEKRGVPNNGGHHRSKSDVGNINNNRLFYNHRMNNTEQQQQLSSDDDDDDDDDDDGFMENNNEHWIRTDADYLVLEL